MSFEDEVNLWYPLSHPHIVSLYGACKANNAPFFVCDYASNGKLSDYLKVESPGMSSWASSNKVVRHVLLWHVHHRVRDEQGPVDEYMR